jgi:hypothetical protein
MNAFLIILAIGLVAGSALLVYHLVHAPVGEQTPDGFRETAPPKTKKRVLSSEPDSKSAPDALSVRDAI